MLLLNKIINLLINYLMSNPSLEMLSSGINAGKNLKKTPKEFKNIPIVKCITHNPI
jgi:hypothetical protein